MKTLEDVYGKCIESIAYGTFFKLADSWGNEGEELKCGDLVRRCGNDVGAADDEHSIAMTSAPLGVMDCDWYYVGLDDLLVLEDQPESIARPILEERKVGKLQVHLLDQGFPNALLEVARVMTWAAENKGYKPHDWKNLPDAENAFEGAASRHRMTHNVQRQGGLPLEKCVDHESLIVHKAHEAFNVLAELELILTGKLV